VGEVTFSLISSNRTFGSGGGAYSNVLNNCLLQYNLCSGDGGGAYVSTLLSCTVVSNANVPGSGAYGGTFGGTASNSIIYFNSSAKGTNISENAATFYCCTLPLAMVGTGNITNAPQFLNMAAGDFRLQSSSPCINAGKNSYVTISTDFAGNARIVGGTVDIGCYEFQSPASVISYGWLAKYGLPTDGSGDFVDTDGDGLNNWQEWRAGTDPTDPFSALEIIGASNAGTGVTITWQSVTGVSYFVQSASDLSVGSPFSTIQSNIAGQAGVTTFTDPAGTNASAMFYRVGVQ
jgi:hypothetical protein